MLFHSLEFLIFFPMVVLLYFVLPLRIKNYWLLFASYVFYMSWNPIYGFLLLGCTIVTWGGAIVVERAAAHRYQKRILILTLLVVFGALFYYKYMNFILENIGMLTAWLGINAVLPKFDIILPVGISFFTFQAAGYLIDVYRRDIYAERNFFRYALFVSFFPQLVAGPIERSKNLLKQLDKSYSFDYGRVRRGLLMMLWGYFLKLVIADRCAILVDTVFGHPQDYYGIQLIIAAMLFSVQIYCDFMGYTTIARGAACVIGYRLIDNFRQPYFATSMKDFWRRWHISLSTWFRDYLYIPLGGNRVGFLRRNLNLMITFLVSGLWHGASWTFVIWGGLHGILIVIEGMCTPFVKTFCKIINFDLSGLSYRVITSTKTFLLATAAWVFFRATNIDEALSFLRRSTDISNAGTILNGGLYMLGLDERNLHFLGFGLFVLIVYSLLRECGLGVSGWLSSQGTAVRYIVYWTIVILIVFSLNLSGKEFIYFQF